VAVAGEAAALEVIAELVHKLRRVVEAADYTATQKNYARFTTYEVYAEELERRFDAIRDIISEDAEQRS
jgi:hypothetical protein